jgi:hypothetical protein
MRREVSDRTRPQSVLVADCHARAATPERSTDAIVVHHPEANYFNAKERGIPTLSFPPRVAPGLRRGRGPGTGSITCVARSSAGRVGMSRPATLARSGGVSFVTVARWRPRIAAARLDNTPPRRAVAALA